MKISKEEFVKALNQIEVYSKKIDKIRKDLPGVSNDISDIVGPMLDSFIRVLCIACDLNPDVDYGDDISWFIFETNFGDICNTVTYNDKEYEITCAKKLYDFIELFNKNKKSKRG